MSRDFSFRLIATDGKARRGEITMPRGTIRTPAFMPVGTGGTVKAMYLDQVRDLGSDVILGNTYHLMLRPGAERVARLGGLHDFARWPYPILTDSGGFQVMSLSKLRKLTENGVTFRSHIDGSAHEMTPERSFRACLIPTSRCNWTSARLCLPRATRSNGPWSCRCVGQTVARRHSAISRERPCSRSCKAAT